MRKLITVGVAVAGLVVGGAVPALAATPAPTITCGDTPGFCPSPPTGDPSGSDSGYVVGTDGDF